ncbi:MAG: RsiV family protein [Hyphomonadaceae bacterium]|nr:RsiV family protein [Hyphomonadaceae bacterium]
MKAETSIAPIAAQGRRRDRGAVRLAATLLCLAAAACGADRGGDGESAAAKAAESARALVEAAADPCTGAETGYVQALCGDPDLSPLVGQIREELVEAAGALASTEGAQTMAQGQTQWLDATRLACGVGDGKLPLTPEQKTCIKTSLEARARAAQEAVKKDGGYLFQTVEINRAVALPADASEFSEFGVFAITKEIRYPRIEGDTPQIKRFNELMAQRPVYGAQDQTSEVVDYKIAYAGAELVSVRFAMMENALGAAHPSDSEKVVTVVMATGEPLKETDVFAAPPAQWRAELVKRARADLLKQIVERGGARELPDAELADTAVKTKNWLITEDALVLVFPSESIGPRVLGGFEVKIPWTDLAPLLNPNAPAPIRRG